MPVDDDALTEEEPPPRALRRHFAQHNGQALLLACFSLVTAVFLWGMIYLFAYWFTLVGTTVAAGLAMSPQHPVDFSEPSLLLPGFPLKFLCGALIAMSVARFSRRRISAARLREARLYLLWVSYELFMAVPNVTFAVWGNLSALVHLRRRELTKAWGLLRRIHDQGGKLSMSSLRMEIEDEKTLSRVLVALQLVGLVGVRENREGWFLFLQQSDALLALWPPPSAANGRRTF